jgi:hypothetical protein
MACFLKLTCQLKPLVRDSHHSSMIPKIRYIAVYQVAPVSAITHMAEVADIEPWKDTQKYCVNFKEPAQKIGPIPLVSGGRVAAAQSIRYTSFARLQKAKSLDDVFLATKPTQLAFSRTTSFAFLSSLIPRKTGCRRRSSRVHSVNFIWQTITGFTQCQRSISAAVNP